MKCPKCGGEIAFYDLRPNCKHCGVNIFYYSQDDLLARDAKRTELEAAVARMVIARIKATFIGGKLQIFRLIFTLLAVAALLLPFGGLTLRFPFYEGGISVGLIGLIQGFTGGLLMKVPQMLSSALIAKQTLAVCVDAVALVLVALVDVILLVLFILSFFNLTKSTTRMRNVAVAGMVVSIAAQIVCIVMDFVTPDTDLAVVSFGFGGLLSCAVFLILFLLNRALLKKGIEPTYREYDPKRRELLKQVRKGEVNLDDLPLPVFESEEEHEARMKALENTLKEEGA